jgi:hypothetical protein
MLTALQPHRRKQHDIQRVALQGAEKRGSYMAKVTEPLVPQSEWAGAQREAVLELIWRYTHADYKGIAGEVWEKNQGRRTIVVNRNGGSALTLLDDLSADDINIRLDYINYKLGFKK